MDTIGTANCSPDRGAMIRSDRNLTGIPVYSGFRFRVPVFDGPPFRTGTRNEIPIPPEILALANRNRKPEITTKEGLSVPSALKPSAQECFITGLQ